MPASEGFVAVGGVVAAPEIALGASAAAAVAFTATGVAILVAGAGRVAAFACGAVGATSTDGIVKSIVGTIVGNIQPIGFIGIIVAPMDIIAAACCCCCRCAMASDCKYCSHCVETRVNPGGIALF